MTQAEQAEQVSRGTAAWRARVEAGLPEHGLGASLGLSGNVQHLVSPIVGMLRLQERDGERPDASDMAYIIDRLSFVLELARERDGEEGSEIAVLERRVTSMHVVLDQVTEREQAALAELERVREELRRVQQEINGSEWGVMFADGSVAQRWNGRTQRARADDEVKRLQEEYPDGGITLAHLIDGVWTRVGEQVRVSVRPPEEALQGPQVQPGGVLRSADSGGES